MMPLGSSSSQCRHQRMHSSRKPIFGPGTPQFGYMWVHGPIMPLRGPLRFCISRNTGSEYPSVQPVTA